MIKEIRSELSVITNHIRSTFKRDGTITSPKSPPETPFSSSSSPIMNYKGESRFVFTYGVSLYGGSDILPEVEYLPARKRKLFSEIY